MQRRTIFSSIVVRFYVRFWVMFCVLAVGGQIAAAEPSQASEGDRAERRGQRSQRLAQRLERLTEELNLTEAQTAEIRSLSEQQQNQARTLRGDNSLSRAEKREQGKEIRQATQEGVRRILTSEQQERFAEMRKQAGERRGGRRGRRNSR